MNKKQRLVNFSLGAGITALGGSMTSVGLYSIANAKGSEWLLQHYFMAVFGIAGAILGVLIFLTGLLFAAGALEEDTEGDSE